MSSPSESIAAVNMADAIAAAAERRNQEQAQAARPSAAQLAADHERRQSFRRLIEPGISRPNSKEQYLATLKTLSTIAENLIREPDNVKFQQFKPTNSVIKRNLVDPKGALEYAVELGFRPEVIKFQPYYTFNSRYMADLKIGAAILQEALKLETEKQERASRNKVDEKAVAAEIARKVKLAYMDDRQSKELADERERQRREIRLAAIARGEIPAAAEPLPTRRATRAMPGEGQALVSPPPYEENERNDEDDSEHEQ